jgi:hypothetical protein
MGSSFGSQAIVRFPVVVRLRLVDANGRFSREVAGDGGNWRAGVGVLVLRLRAQ